MFFTIAGPPPCDEPEQPDNTTVSGGVNGNVTYGQYLRYYCVPGYILDNGTLTRYCELNQTLSGAPPVCVGEYTTYIRFIVYYLHKICR